MKRFLLLFCAVVLIGAIMIVPAFAAESFTVIFSEASYGYIDADPLSLNGWYLTVSVESYTGSSYTFDPIQLTFAPSSEERNSVDLNVDGVNVGLMTYWADLGEGNVYFSLDRFPYDPYEAMTNFTFTPTTPPVVDEPGSDAEASPIGSIFDVFGGVGSWIGSQLSSSTSLFWNASTGSLTFLGVLSTCALVFSLILLLVLVVSRFLRFGG